ncbi:hypothetical protein Cme02nite_15350 [Catellatospora methionotrophica]|uniref:UbiC transcription regulator-associated domain-containing protein n=1 Tax=Catellatospora methionotrophica TaxID=121620 RepID=A0A8J3PEC3_9ACTN|nr:UTRA domain-containing protein [Catellatospora methionotrophica]GIG13203.1 hypothetical protein Cme02nite_15350 [Catellatospora methionotrophica]
MIELELEPQQRLPGLAVGEFCLNLNFLRLGSWQEWRLVAAELDELLAVQPEPATAEVAKWLGVPEGAAVLARRRLMLVDEEPYQLGDSYYPHDLVADTPIAVAEPVEEGVLAVLERVHGQPISYFIDELSFRMPTPDEASILRLDPGVSVVRVVRIAYDRDDKPLEAFDQLLAGDKHVLVYEVSAE